MKYFFCIVCLLISLWFVVSQYSISTESEKQHNSEMSRVISMRKGQSLSEINTGFFLSQNDMLRVYYNEDIQHGEKIHIAYTGMQITLPVFVYKNRLGNIVYADVNVSEEDRTLLGKSGGSFTVTKNMPFRDALCAPFIPFSEQKYCFLLGKQVGFYLEFIGMTKDGFSISIQ